MDTHEKVKIKGHKDPGFKILYGDDISTHQCLGLACVATVNTTKHGDVISPPIQGGNAAQSAANYKQWIETIILLTQATR